MKIKKPLYDRKWPLGAIIPPNNHDVVFIVFDFSEPPKRRDYWGVVFRCDFSRSPKCRDYLTVVFKCQVFGEARVPPSVAFIAAFFPWDAIGGCERRDYWYTVFAYIAYHCFANTFTQQKNGIAPLHEKRFPESWGQVAKDCDSNLYNYPKMLQTVLDGLLYAVGTLKLGFCHDLEIQFFGLHDFSSLSPFWQIYFR